LKEELDREYLSFFKAKVNNMSYYYDKKQERIESTAGSKRKHLNSEDIGDETKSNKIVK
jgi:hypothetical protein